MPHPSCHVHADDPAGHAAQALADALRAARRRRNRVRLAVAGGSVVPVLAAAHRLAADLWPDVHLTWVDERCVPQADPASNAGAARAAGVLEGPAPGHVLPLLLDTELDDPSRACARVDRSLAAQFDGALDVTLLGLGEDGHVASLFPGRAWPADARVHVVDAAPKPPARRITLARAFIATATAHVVFAIGAGKRAAIARTCAGDPLLPLAGLAGVQLHTDRAGAPPAGSPNPNLIPNPTQDRTA